MDVLKVFVDEPFALEPVASEPRPRVRPPAAVGGSPHAAPEPMAGLAAFLAPSPYARAYLAGSHRAAAPLPGEPAETGWRTGLTALAETDAWRAPLLALGAHPWRTVPGGRDAAAALLRPDNVRALASAPGAVQGLLEAFAAGDGREAFGALRALLDAAPGALVLAPEPAHDGHDWILYGRASLRERLVAALRAQPAPGVRRWVMPYQRARGEHRFYLERWALGALPDYVDAL